MTRPTALVFDFFGVICSGGAPEWLARHVPIDRVALVKSEIVGAADKGEVEFDEMCRRLSSVTGRAAGEIEAEWLVAAILNPEKIALVEAQRANFKLGPLTNAPAEFFWNIFHRLGGRRIFDAVVVSSEEKCAKPDPRAYTIVLQRLGVRADQAATIDDNPANIAAAGKLGMKGILFTDVDSLRHALGRLSNMPSN